MARVSLDTLLERSTRNMGAVVPQIKDMAIEIVKRAYSEGINVQISSGYRSNDEQTRLYNQGRTTSGRVVTNAKAGQSVHNYGLAIDYFLTTHDGSGSTWTVNKEWKRVASIGKSMGFTWGGDWTSFYDAPHLEYTKGLTWRDLQAGKRPSFSNVSINPEKKGYLELHDEGGAVKEMQQLLNKVGQDVEEDGYFGELTENALKSFQRSVNLTADGVFGSQSKSALEKATAPKPKPEPVKEDEEMKEKVVVVNSTDDFPAALRLSNRIGAGLVSLTNAKREQYAKEAIVVGGSAKGVKADKITDLSGADYFETAKKVNEYMKK